MIRLNNVRLFERRLSVAVWRAVTVGEVTLGRRAIRNFSRCVIGIIDAVISYVFS